MNANRRNLSSLRIGSSWLALLLVVCTGTVLGADTTSAKENPPAASSADKKNDSAAAAAPRRKGPPKMECDGTGTALFDGETLKGWAVAEFAGHGEVRVEKEQIHLDMGAMLSGVTYTNPVPRMDFEVSLEAMRVSGGDFFCGLTVPYAETNFTFVVGGWGGGVVGISSLDGNDASSNETTKFLAFESKRWYKIRLRVTRGWLEAWIDGEKMVNEPVAERRVGMRAGEIEINVPLGIATWQTSAALRNLKICNLKPSP